MHKYPFQKVILLVPTHIFSSLPCLKNSFMPHRDYSIANTCEKSGAILLYLENRQVLRMNFKFLRKRRRKNIQNKHAFCTNNGVLQPLLILANILDYKLT